MKRQLLCALLCSTILAGWARAANVTINYASDGVNDASNDPLADNSLVLLLVNTTGTGFNTLTPGSLSLGSFLDGNYEVIGRTGVDGSFNPGAFSGQSIETYGADFSQGDQLAIVWIPDLNLTTGNSLTLGESYGLYTTNTSDWIVSSPGAMPTMDPGVPAGTEASFVVSSVPEPATYAAIAAAASLGWVLVRRRRLVAAV